MQATSRKKKKGPLKAKKVSTHIIQNVATSNRSAMSISRADLVRWVRNFRENKDLPIITRSALIGFKELQNYLAEVEQSTCNNGKTPDGFRIYFIRYSGGEIPEDDRKYYEFTSDGRLTQVSLLLVPTTNYGGTRIYADDCIGSDDEILAFPIGHRDRIGEGTGLCPPNCGGSFGDP